MRAGRRDAADHPAAELRPHFTIHASDENAAPRTRLRLRRGEIEVAFLVTATVFSAPQQVTLDELLIESSFPLDVSTRAVCMRLAFA